MSTSSSPIDITLFSHVTRPREHERLSLENFDELVALLTEFSEYPAPPQKEDLPLISAALYDDGETRNNENVRGLGRVVILDYDECHPESFELARAWASQYSAVLYTSFSDTPEKRKFRLIFELDRNPRVSEHHALISMLSVMAPAGIGPLDEGCKAISRAYFIPCARPGAVIEHYTGAVLRVDDLTDGVVAENATSPADAVPASLPPLSKADLLHLIRRKWLRRKSPTRDWEKFAEHGRLLASGKQWAPKGERDRVTFELIAQIIDDTGKDPSGLMIPVPLKMEENGGVTEYIIRQKVARHIKKKAIATEPALDISDDLDDDLPHRDFTELPPPILQYGGFFYVRKEDGGYAECVDRASVQAAVHRYLDDAPDVVKKTRTKTGMRFKSSPELITEYNLLIDKVRYSIAEKETRYDADEYTLRIATCPPRVSAEYSELAQQWLETIGGPKKEVLLNWVASVPDLDNPTCALALVGPAQTNKTSMAYGLKRIWQREGHPTPWHELVSKYNKNVAHCPLILADESFTTDFKYRGSIQLRDKLIEYSRSVEDKYKPKYELLGCLRVVIAINNLNRLHTDEMLNLDDLAAIGERLLILELNDWAQEIITFWDDKKDLKDTFYRSDTLAKHALWLHENRKYEKAGRLLVEGDAKSLQRVMGMGSVRDEVLAVLAMSLRKLDMWQDTAERSRPVIVDKDDRVVYVNSKALADHWSMLSNQHCPPTTQIGRAMKNISDGEKRFQTKEGYRRYYRIKNYHLLAAIQFGDMDIYELESIVGPIKEDD